MDDDYYRDLVVISFSTGVGIVGWMAVLSILMKSLEGGGMVLLRTNRHGEMWFEIIISILCLSFIPISTGYLIWRHKKKKKQ